MSCLYHYCISMTVYNAPVNEHVVYIKVPFYYYFCSYFKIVNVTCIHTFSFSYPFDAPAVLRKLTSSLCCLAKCEFTVCVSKHANCNIIIHLYNII